MHLNNNDSLDEFINSTDLFFTRVIDMIPKSLYNPKEEDEEAMNLKYQKVK